MSMIPWYWLISIVPFSFALGFFVAAAKAGKMITFLMEQNNELRRRNWFGHPEEVKRNQE